MVWMGGPSSAAITRFVLKYSWWWVWALSAKSCLLSTSMSLFFQRTSIWSRKSLYIPRRLAFVRSPTLYNSRAFVQKSPDCITTERGNLCVCLWESLFWEGKFRRISSSRCEFCERWPRTDTWVESWKKIFWTEKKCFPIEINRSGAGALMQFSESFWWLRFHTMNNCRHPLAHPPPPPPPLHSSRVPIWRALKDVSAYVAVDVEHLCDFLVTDAGVWNIRDLGCDANDGSWFRSQSGSIVHKIAFSRIVHDSWGFPFVTFSALAFLGKPKWTMNINTWGDLNQRRYSVVTVYNEFFSAVPGAQKAAFQIALRKSYVFCCKTMAALSNICGSWEAPSMNAFDGVNIFFILITFFPLQTLRSCRLVFLNILQL